MAAAAGTLSMTGAKVKVCRAFRVCLIPWVPVVRWTSAGSQRLDFAEFYHGSRDDCLRALLGPLVVLIGLLIVGPCSALLTGRWVPTALTGLWAIGLAVVLGVPDGIWGSTTHLAFIAAVASVALATIAAAALISKARFNRPGN